MPGNAASGRRIGRKGKRAMSSFFAVIAAGVLAAALGAEVASADPARIIILRHGEKTKGGELCAVGALRAQALKAQYLGRNAPGNATIYGPGGKPDAFFAITAHTQETATPSAQSWGQQIVAFSVPEHDQNEEADLDTQTQQAAATLQSSAYDGKTVVIVWEHKRIANKNLDETWRKLLKLGEIDSEVPKKWEGDNYDYFWLVDYSHRNPTFRRVKQVYSDSSYAQVPDNDWGVAPDPAKFAEFYQECENKADE
jgi:hypothetical protein